MSVRIVRLGTPRKPGEGPRLGTVRRPPRGVPKRDFAKLDYYDLWLPVLSPSAELVKQALHAPDDKAWAKFVRAFRSEIQHGPGSQVLDLLATLSHVSSFSLGCYCEDESRCHRSVLRAMLSERGAEIAAPR
jgi:uncharacterized protein YeaO (DUF488 family)